MNANPMYSEDEQTCKRSMPPLGFPDRHTEEVRAEIKARGRLSMIDYAESVEYLRGCKRLDDSHAAMKRVIVEGE